MKKKMKYITVMPILGLKNLDGEHHGIPCMQAYFIYRVFRKKAQLFLLQQQVVDTYGMYKFFQSCCLVGLCAARSGIIAHCPATWAKNIHFVQKQITVKSRVLTCLVQKHMQVFSDCLLRGFWILMHCDLLTKS